MSEQRADQSFDVVVVGAGPGGYVAAIRAAQLGRSVAVVEERFWGGVCLNVGCIPSKALLRNAEIVHLFQHQAATFGIEGEVSFDYAVAHQRSRDVAEGRAKGVHFLMRKNGITEINGRGSFVDAHTLEVTSTEDVQRISFQHAIVATGARPAVPSGIALSTNVVTYEDVLLDPALPGSILIVGAGAIGMELGYVLANYGVEVTIVEYADRALPAEDADVSREVAKAYRKLGVKVSLKTRVTGVVDDGTKVTVVAEGPDGTVEHRVDRVLVATGFRPNTESLGLAAAGIDVDDRGAVVIDERMRTSQPHVHAIGDVTMRLQLAHVAEAMGVVAAETLAGAVTMEPGDYRMMPRATFCQPPRGGAARSLPRARGSHDQSLNPPVSAPRTRPAPPYPRSRSHHAGPPHPSLGRTRRPHPTRPNHRSRGTRAPGRPRGGSPSAHDPPSSRLRAARTPGCASGGRHRSPSSS
ncbi:dihydrolipoamide dehydrogenase [Actinomadura madurae]|uniref:Dihydrolipoamide dehydrogenase n=1 Tax=Actinomadura madurae TaxID=1993 RepID=A0A1I5TL43_9ACTN|nr:NAD(P)/FAD-dependent oxidoreductase [Actinomadura madurae]SFP83794.1 dihydrolipoamide dehydrogenase [Actinomadura madurae]